MPSRVDLCGEREDYGFDYGLPFLLCWSLMLSVHLSDEDGCGDRSLN